MTLPASPLPCQAPRELLADDVSRVLMVLRTKGGDPAAIARIVDDNFWTVCDALAIAMVMLKRRELAEQGFPLPPNPYP